MAAGEDAFAEESEVVSVVVDANRTAKGRRVLGRGHSSFAGGVVGVWKMLYFGKEVAERVGQVEKRADERTKDDREGD